MQVQAVIALAVFTVTYGMIVVDKINRSVVALTGAMLLIALGVLDQHRAVEAIDFNTIGLLVGMMAVIAVLSRTGLFEYIAIKATKLSRGRPLVMMLYFSVITAVVSAFLDNVTTILLMVPVTLGVSRTLRIDPVPFVAAQVIASNVGGTTTLIGDPPNIMIGSATGLGFWDFVLNLGPVIFLVILPTTMIYFIYVYRKTFATRSVAATDESTVDGAGAVEELMELDERRSITDPALLRKSLAILGVILAGFALHQLLHLESATVALIGATLMMLISPDGPEEIFKEIEWTTIFFFAGLFVVVGALEHTGVIEQFASGIIGLTNGNPVFTGMLILWGSAVASAFVDNIPFTATMIPLIFDIGTATNMDVTPYWWALSLGACLGGNGTIIGASANVVAAGMLKEADRDLSYVDYLKVAAPITSVMIAISALYLLFFQL